MAHNPEHPISSRGGLGLSKLSLEETAHLSGTTREEFYSIDGRRCAQWRMMECSSSEVHRGWDGPPSRSLFSQ
jgi:hypothetical protein